jgi:hypothetical protein
VKTRFDKAGYPLYCDAGPHEGEVRAGLVIRLYLSPQEYARYGGPESLSITLSEPATEPAPAGGTAEPPGSGRRAAGRRAATPGSLPALAAPGEFLSHSASTAKEHRDERS